MTVESVARFIGLYAVEILIGLVVVITVLISLSWHLFERYYPSLWRGVSNLWRKLVKSEIFQRWRQRVPYISDLQRLTPLQYMGIFLPIGLFVSLIMFAMFSEMAEAVIEESRLTYFDQVLANSLYAGTTPQEVFIFNIVTQLAGRWASIIVGLGVSAILLVWKRRLLLIGWIAAILGTSIINAALKAFFQRPRPVFSNPIIVEQNWSFPSGHAMGALILYGMLAYLIMRGLNRPLTQMGIILVVTLVLLIGFSRMYLGVHYFSDVVAGYLAGTAWLAIVISGTEVALRRKRWLQSNHVITNN